MPIISLLRGFGSQRRVPTCPQNTFLLVISFTSLALDFADKATVTTSPISGQHPSAPTALGITYKFLHLAHLALRPRPWPPVQQECLTPPLPSHLALPLSEIPPPDQPGTHPSGPWLRVVPPSSNTQPPPALLCQAIHFSRPSPEQITELSERGKSIRIQNIS